MEKKKFMNRLPGEGKRDSKPSGKMHNVRESDTFTTLAEKDVRQLMGKSVYPTIVDISGSNYRLTSDEFVQHFTNCLKELDISNNHLAELNGLSALTKLKRLKVNDNKLKKINLSGLISLEYLSLAGNSLEVVPEMTDLKALVNINLSRNRLKRGFNEMAKANKLQVVDISNNNMKFAIEEVNGFVLLQLRKLPELKYLTFSGNPCEKNIESFRHWIIFELPNLLVLNSEKITKQERTQAAEWKAKWNDKNKPVTLGSNVKKDSDDEKSDGEDEKKVEAKPPEPEPEPPKPQKEPEPKLNEVEMNFQQLEDILSSSDDQSTNRDSDNVSVQTTTSVNYLDQLNEIVNEGENSKSGAKPSAAKPAPSATKPVAQASKVTTTAKAPARPASTATKAPARPSQAPSRAPPPKDDFDDLAAALEDVENIAPAAKPKEHHKDDFDLLDDLTSQLSAPAPSSSKSRAGTKNSAPNNNYDEIDELADLLSDAGNEGSDLDKLLASSFVTNKPISNELDDLLNALDDPPDMNTSQSSISTTSRTTSASKVQPTKPAGRGGPAGSPTTSASSVKASNSRIPEPKAQSKVVPTPAPNRQPASTSAPKTEPKKSGDGDIFDMLDDVLQEISDEPERAHQPKPIDHGHHSESGRQQHSTPAFKSGTDNFGFAELEDTINELESKLLPPDRPSAIQENEQRKQIEIREEELRRREENLKRQQNESERISEEQREREAQKRKQEEIFKKQAEEMKRRQEQLNKRDLDSPSSDFSLSQEPFQQHPQSAYSDPHPTAYNSNPYNNPRPNYAQPQSFQVENSPYKQPIGYNNNAPDLYSKEQDLLRKEEELRRTEEEWDRKRRDEELRYREEQLKIQEQRERERIARTEADRKRQEEEERRIRIEEERYLREAEEKRRIAREREEQERREAEERRRVGERRRQEEEERARREMEIRKREEEERERQLAEERARKTREESVRKARELEERELELQRREDAIRKRLEQETEERRKREERILKEQQDMLENELKNLAYPWKAKWKDITFGEKLGIGVFGTTSKGLWRGQEVTIKQLRCQSYTDAFLQRVLDEIPPLAALRHPQLIEYIGVCVENTISAICPFVHGTPLYGFIRNSGVEIDDKLKIQILHQTADALAYLHSQAILHLSLKTKNIILDFDMNVKIRDFGWKLVKDEVAIAGAIGTPEYDAPELLRGEPYDGLADVYSFAICAWELWTRQTPYLGTLPRQIIQSVLNERMRPPINEITIPPAICKLLTDCWTDRPTDRLRFGQIVEYLSRPLESLLDYPTNSYTIFTQQKAGVEVVGNPYAVPSSSLAPSSSSRSSIGTSHSRAGGPTSPAHSTTPGPTSRSSASSISPSPVGGTGYQSRDGAMSEKSQKIVVVLNKIVELLKVTNEPAQVKALKAVHNIASDPGNAEGLEHQGLVDVLISTLYSSFESVQENACLTISEMSKYGPVANMFIKKSLFPVLITLLRTPNDSIVINSLRAIGSLLNQDSFDTKTLFNSSGGLQKLIETINFSNNDFVLQQAMICLVYLFQNEGLKKLASEANMQGLVHLFDKAQPPLKITILNVWSQVATCFTGASCLNRLGVKQKVSPFLQSPNPETQRLAACILDLLSNLSSIDPVPPFFPTQAVAPSPLSSSSSRVGSVPSSSSSSRVGAPVPLSSSSSRVAPVAQLPPLAQPPTSQFAGLMSPDAVQRDQSAQAAFNLSQDKIQKQGIVSGGGIPGLVSIITNMAYNAQITVDNSILALVNLTDDPSVRRALVNEGALVAVSKVLVDFYANLDPTLTSRILWALSNFALDDEFQHLLFPAFPALLACLQQEGPPQSMSLKCFLILAKNPIAKSELKQAGAEATLYQLTQSPNRTLALASNKILTLLNS